MFPVIALFLLQVVAQPATFDAEYARLKQGRTYAKDVSTGALRRRHGRFEYWLVIPPNYDPTKRYQVRFQLHGGVMREDSLLRGDGSVRLAGGEQIYIMPSSWNEAPWWSDAQAGSLRAILGISGGLFLNNLRNKPFFVVNGGKDPLYPSRIVEPLIAFMTDAGVPITYRPQPQAGHDTSWWPTVRDEFETFTRTHPRVPLPDRLTWEVSSTRTWNRAHWLTVGR